MKNYNRIVNGKYVVYYYLNNKLHRIDGPAIEGYQYKEWWIEGSLIDCKSQEEFERYIKLKLFW
jgi:hypothetical protein